MICVILSQFLLQSLQRGVLLVLSILYLTELVLIACSCTLQRRLSVSLFNSHFLNSYHFLLLLQHSVSLTNSPSNAFFFYAINFFLVHVGKVLFQVDFSCFSLDYSFLTLRCILLQIAFLLLHIVLNTRLLPPPLCGTQSLSIHDLGWSPSYMVMSSLVFLFIL